MPEQRSARRLRTKIGDCCTPIMKYTAIQVLKKSDRSEIVFAAVDGLDVPVIVKRLKEANPEIYRGIAKLRNQHIPLIYSIREQGEELCIVEEYIDGQTLEVYLAQEPLTDVQKIGLMIQLCEALEILHQCKPAVIHRDIKPSNILISEDGVLKIIDFDASRQYKAEKNTSDTRLLGTIEYAAPEQFGYSQTDVRSDVYSIGVVLNELNIQEASSLKKWKTIVDKCTSFDPENRYKNVAELKKELTKCVVKAKRPLWKRALYPVLGCAALLALFLIGRLYLPGVKEQETLGDAAPTPTAPPATSSPTEAPELLSPTEMPITPGPTEAAEPEVEDLYPWQRYESVGENGTVRKHKVLKGKWSEIVGYTISHMDYMDSYNVDYRINDSGSLWMKPDKIYGSVNFELRDVIDMAYCNEMVIRMKNEVGDIAIILYDEDYMPVETLYQGKTDGACEVHFSPRYNGKVEYIGFMANDGELMDYSEFETVIYYVDFHVLNTESAKISYQIGDLKEENYYFMERSYNEDGSVYMDFERIYGELKLTLPEPVDLRYCRVIGVKMESEPADLTVTYFDKDFNAIEWSGGHRTEGIQEKLFDPIAGGMVYAIGLMTDDESLTDYTDCDATVYEVNFYMEDGYVK